MKKSTVLLVIIICVICLCLIWVLVLKQDISNKSDMNTIQNDDLNIDINYDIEKSKLKEKFIDDSIESALDRYGFESEEEEDRYRTMLKNGIKADE